MRRVGFELEYGGIDPERSAAIVGDICGGDLVRESPFRYRIDHAPAGTFYVEIDARFLKERKYREYLSSLNIDVDRLDSLGSLEKVLRDIASTVVPCEIVTPPVPMDNLALLDDIVEALRQNKAEGTKSSLLYAFGLHINPDLASGDPRYLLNHMRAFCLLYDWICADSGVDFTRRLTPYINRYPEKYVHLILGADYRPDIHTLIDDYLALVGSRNHALDMLPALADIDAATVLAAAAEPELIKPRPAFHYRLANSLIDDPAWDVAGEWNYWVLIERLADDESLLAEFTQAYRRLVTSPFDIFRGAWVDHVATRIEALAR